MDYLYHVEVAPGLGYDCIAEEGLKLVPGDVVIVQCERYQDYATVSLCHDEEGPVVPEQMDVLTQETNKGRHVEGHRVPKVIRRAQGDDQEKAKRIEQTAQTMAEQANERIAAHKLDMKLVHTHFSFDERLVIFQFAAEGRIDFRELLRDLSHVLRTRVELRQVGVRDEAAMRGGIGVCGRPFCCATFLKRFSSISVKMAKVQGLSLNPLNISGACGRLKCCLQYEYSQYRDDLAEEKRRRAEGCQETCAGCGGREDGEPEAGDESSRDNRNPQRERERPPRSERPEQRRPERPKREEKPAPPAEQAATSGPAESEAGEGGSRRSGRRRRGRRRGRRGGGENQSPPAGQGDAK
jgi:cell fate regulator YaaT (PSP1 superfamily)